MTTTVSACPNCGKTCKSKAGLTTHMNAMHGVLSPSQIEQAIKSTAKLRPTPTLSPTETVSDYKNKEVSMSTTTMLDPKRGWIPAIEERYYPSLFERVKHFIGIHCWTITPHPRECVMCGKIEKRWIIFNKTSGGSTNNGNGYNHKTISLSIYTRLGSGDDGTRSNL